MKRGLTLIELIFVIIIIGILSAVLTPRFNRPTLTEAAHQLISHIRYTQHLAMVDNKFDPNDDEWYKDRWQIFFAKTNGSDKHWAYSIFADTSGMHTGTPDVVEIARNILNPSMQYMTGGYSAGTIPYYIDADSSKGIDSRGTKNMNLGHKYNIEYIKFDGGCNAGVVKRIAFDNVGRPLYGNSRYLNSKYNGTTTPAGSHLLESQCVISLCLDNPCSAVNDRFIKIAIEAETGYAHIL